MKQRGFTLVEVLVTCTLVGLLAGVALPSYRDQLVRGRRVDAVAALTRVQAAEDSYRAQWGVYSTDFSALKLAERSAEGWYALALQSTGSDAYRATATALATGPQAADAACQQLLLDVNSGFAQIGPNTRCWNR